MENIIKQNNERKLNILKGFKEFDEIKKSHKVEFKSACGIIFKDKKVLLGLSNADDDRNGKFCFPGGGIESNEDCISAAIRETYEEMNINSKAALHTPIYHVTKPNVAFIILQSEDLDDITLNEEFDSYDFFDVDNLPENILSVNKDILKLTNYKVA